MSFEYERREFKKFEKILREYFLISRGNPDYPFFVSVLYEPLLLKYHYDVDKTWKEIKTILDQSFDEMNAKNDALLCLIDVYYSLSGGTIVDETYEYAITHLVTWDFNLESTWKFINSQLEELGPAGFNRQCIHFFGMIDRVTDDWLNNLR